MKLEQTEIEKKFLVKQDGKQYTIVYNNSDGFALELFNKFCWEIYDEHGKKLRNFVPQNLSEETKIEVRKEVELANQLINFCVINFNAYIPELP